MYQEALIYFVLLQHQPELLFGYRSLIVIQRQPELVSIPHQHVLNKHIHRQVLALEIAFHVLNPRRNDLILHDFDYGDLLGHVFAAFPAHQVHERAAVTRRHQPLFINDQRSFSLMWHFDLNSLQLIGFH